MRCNDNEFVYNRILGYNTACYDLDTNYWYWDEVHSQATTCYIKFSAQQYDYIQHLRPQTITLDTINNKEQIIPIDPINDKEIIIPIAKVFPTAEVLEGIVKHIIPLYIHVMFKVNSIVTIHPTSNVSRLNEFQIKTVPRLELLLHRIGKSVITDHVNFSLTKINKEFYEHKLKVYSNHLSVKYKLLIKHVYDHLIVEELK